VGFRFTIGEQQRPRGTDGLVLLLKSDRTGDRSRIRGAK
jgi:hypothetical protein